MNSEPVSTPAPAQPNAKISRIPLHRRFADSNLLKLSAINVALFAVLSILSPDVFLTATNMESMAVQLVGFAILALAMLVPMLTGGIDLSIISLANLSAIVGALTMNALVGDSYSFSIGVFGAVILSLSISLLCGAFGGLLNGIIIAVVGISPILATLATGLVFLGVAVVITGGSAVTGLPAMFGWIGSGSVGFLPVSVIILFLAAIVLAFILTKTAFGVKVYLFGTNALASRFAGISNSEITVKTYVLSGTYAALAGIIIAARANSAKADYAASYLLLSILVCVLGGVSPFGGTGKVSGVILAVIALQFLSSGLNILGVSNFATEFVWGGLLLLVMSINQIGTPSRS